MARMARHGIHSCRGRTLQMKPHWDPTVLHPYRTREAIAERYPRWDLWAPCCTQDPSQKCNPIGCRHEILSHAEGTRASRKGPLDGARDPPSFSAGMVDPMHSSRDMPVNLTLQLTSREKLISNLRRNMPVLPDSLECAALRADMEGNRLNSRFPHTHKNKSVKAHGVMEEKSVIIQDEYHYLDKYQSMAIGCQQ